MSSHSNEPMTILVVEDEAEQRELIGEILKSAGYQVTTTGSAESGLARLANDAFDMVLTDSRLPGQSGEQLLAQVKQNYPDLPVVIATAYASIDSAVSAIKGGATDYLSKPFSRETLLFTVNKVIANEVLRRENQQLRGELSQREQLVDMIGRSKIMQNLFRQIERLADTNATILINGESGSGKELAARALHQLSGRAKQPFVAINCGAIPENLAEAELFGNEKGAFTGAHKLRRGHFEIAHGGSLFLDEVAELPLNLQTRLLRVLQERRVQRVGATHELEVDVRVIAASHKNLPQLVADGLFREDLFYRLNVVPLRIPPLRERREDILTLANHLLTETAKRHNLDKPKFSAGAGKVLFKHSWPGNVRELGNTIERAVLLCAGEHIDGSAITEALQVAPPSPELSLPPAGLDWEQTERSFLRQALEQSAGNKTRAAQLLGLSYKAFLYRLEKYQLET